MALLPFHIQKLATLRPVILCWILLIPFVTAIATIERLAPERPKPPFTHRIDHISNILAIPPVRLAEAANLPIVLGIFAIGYSFGWLLNYVALMIVRHSSLPEITRIIAAGIVPAEWERVDAKEKLLAARAIDQDVWAALQKTGIFRYIVLRGGLFFGSVCFVGINIVLPLVTLRPVAISSLPIWFFIWVSVGVAIASFTWLSLKFSQRGEA